MLSLSTVPKAESPASGKYEHLESAFLLPPYPGERLERVSPFLQAFNVGISLVMSRFGTYITHHLGAPSPWAVVLGVKFPAQKSKWWDLKNKKRNYIMGAGPSLYMEIIWMHSNKSIVSKL